MNEPIISPLLVYFAGIADQINCLFGVTSIILLFSVLAYFMLNDLNGTKIKKSTLSALFISTIICAVIATFFPDKNTIYQIAIAKMTTPANINKVLDTGKSIKDSLKTDLIDVINSFKDKEEPKK